MVQPTSFLYACCIQGPVLPPRSVAPSFSPHVGITVKVGLKDTTSIKGVIRHEEDSVNQSTVINPVISNVWANALTEPHPIVPFACKPPKATLLSILVTIPTKRPKTCTGTSTSYIVLGEFLTNPYWYPEVQICLGVEHLWGDDQL